MPSNFRALAAHSYDSRADMLGQRHFTLVLFGALLLHVLALYVWHLLPKPHVIDIPVRVLNIKLGDGDTVSPEELAAAGPSADNSAAVENVIARMVRDENRETARTESVVNSMEKAMSALRHTATTGVLDKAIEKKVVSPASVLAGIARQFVRDTGISMASPAAGNSNAKDADLVSRYEQLISLWIQKFKLYPDEARAGGMEGETVVRVRIDRRGNIRYWALEASTGYQMLDRAAIDMIRRANPVPAVPNDYPPGDLLEFLVPVSFRLQ